MSRLPNAQEANIEERKITAYLLASNHVRGGTKAAFFRQFCFRVEDWKDLPVAILIYAGEIEVKHVERTRYGTKYVVEGPLVAPDGRRPQITTVWFVGVEGQSPRLVSAYPIQRRRAMIPELDAAVLTRGLPEQGLEAGDVGTVVMVHQGGEAYEVEFVTLGGETLAVVTVPGDALRPVGEREIAHAREVA